MRRALVVLGVLLACTGAARGSAARVLDVWADDPTLLDVQIVRTDGAVSDARKDQELGESDRIRTGYKSHARLDFSGKATVVVEELSEFKVGVFKLGKTSQVELWLKAGEVQAQVRHEAATRTEFVVRTPTSTASVRGTQINSILYTPQSGMLISMGREGSLRALQRGGGPILVQHDEHAREDSEGKSFRDDAHLRLDDARSFVAPVGLDRQEQDVTALSPLASTSTVNTGSGGSSLGPLAPSVVGSPLPSVLAVEGSIDPDIASKLLLFGFNPVVTSDVTTLNGSLAPYVGVLIAKGADAFPYLSQIQSFHDSGKGVVYDGSALLSTFGLNTQVPAYLGGGIVASTTATAAVATLAGQQFTNGAVAQGTSLALQVGSGASPATVIHGTLAGTVLAVVPQIAAAAVVRPPPMSAPLIGMLYHDDGRGRAAFVGIDVSSSSAATTLTRAVARKAGGLSP